MPLKYWSPPRPRSPFAPNWTVPMFVDRWSDPGSVAALRDLVLEKEAALKAASEAVPISGISDGLTAHWHAFNVFAWTEPPAVAMRDFVVGAYRAYLEGLRIPRRRAYVQGWANVLRREEKLTPHAHDLSERSYLSGNLCLAARDTVTRYYPPYVYGANLSGEQALGLRNEPGSLTLFPSSIFHETSPNTADEPRVTIGFDVFLDDADVRGRRGVDGHHVPFDDPPAGVAA